MKILFSLLAILSIFSISFVQTSFAEEKTIIILPSILDPACAKNDTCFSPSTLYMNVGDTFTVESHINLRQITFGTPELGPEPYLSGHLEKGIYPYYIPVFPWAVGKIIVGIEDAPKQSYEDNKAKLEKIEQEMKQQQDIKEVVNAKTHITELENRIKNLIKISRDLEFQIEQLKIENNNLKNHKTLQTHDSIETKSKPIASFVDQTKDPQFYIDRYNNEPEYKKWFDENYPNSSIYEAVELEPESSTDNTISQCPEGEEWIESAQICMMSEPTAEPQPTHQLVPTCGKGTELVDGTCQVVKTEKKGGGCLIATATYGSELAPQVQQLRELRDNSLLQTASGTSFMNTFNQFYYSFSPTIADWERENPIFKEVVKITLTPMISTLSILNYVNMDSEVSVLGYGISLIILNVGMYFVAPAVVIHTIRKKL